MSKLIQKSKYIKPAKASGYMRYIATRDNVGIPKRQEQYMKYIAHRPHTEKQGAHGLFSSSGTVDLKAAASEAAVHQGDIWTIIFSLRREDATRLAYDNADSWRELIMMHTDVLASAMKIPVKNFRWYAAFHDEAHHPHVHMMIWSEDPKHGYLTTQGIEKMRSVLTNSIFKEELHALYVSKDISYKDVTAESATRMHQIIESMERGSYINPVVEQRMEDLATALKNTTGKKQYAYLKKSLKAMVDSIVDELSKIPEVAGFYTEWNRVRDELEGYYKDTPREHLPLSKQKEFRAIKNMVIREADNLNRERQERLKAENEESISPALVSSTIKLMHHMSRIFRENSLPPPNPEGIRASSKRRKKLLKKRMAMGHKAGYQ